MEGAQGRPAIRGHPNLYLATALLTTFLIYLFVYALPFQPRWVGWIFVTAAVVGSLASYRQFRRISEDTSKWTTNALVRIGLYRFSRNPMYLMDLVLLVGVSMLLGTWWGIVKLIPAWLMYQYGAVLPEEAYLEGSLTRSICSIGNGFVAGYKPPLQKCKSGDLPRVMNSRLNSAFNVRHFDKDMDNSPNS